MPNVILESLALNKFVISSNCRTGPKEILLNVSKIMKKPVKSPHPIKSTNPVSVLKNKSDVNKESHKLSHDEKYINKNNKCTIL